MDVVYTYAGFFIKTFLIISFALIVKYDGVTRMFQFASRFKFFTGVVLLFLAILYNYESAAFFGWNRIAESNLEVASIIVSGVIYFAGLTLMALGMFRYKKGRRNELA